MTKRLTREEPSSDLAETIPAFFLSPMPFDSLMQVSLAWSKTFQDWQQEMLRFVGARLECDSDVGQKLVNCTNWQDIAELQQSWAKTMTQDYAAEVGRLAELASKLTEDLAAEMPAGRASAEKRPKPAAP